MTAPRPRDPHELQRKLQMDRDEHPYLVWRDDDDALCFQVLDAARGSIVIGRGQGADVGLAWDPRVSRAHAELIPIGDAWTILDDGLSTNGTFVNAGPIRGRQRLCAGDQVRVGDTELLFAKPSAAGDRTTLRPDTPNPLLSLSPAQLRVLVAVVRSYELNDGWPAGIDALATELHLSRDTVKTHLRSLYDRFDLGVVPRNAKRARLAELAIRLGLAGPAATA